MGEARDRRDARAQPVETTGPQPSARGERAPERGPLVPGEHADPASLTRLQRLAGNVAATTVVQRLLKLEDGPSVAVGLLQQQLNAVGTRVAVTGRFDEATEAAVKAFQAKYDGLKPGTGVVDDATKKKLDEMAPTVARGGQQTVEHGPADARGTTFPALGDHPIDIKVGSKGVGVKELQQRINHSPTMAEAKRKARATAKDLLAVDGIFGPLTEAGLKQFQTDNAVPATGVADVNTWKKLTAAGAASQGRVEYEWREEVEGVTNVGGRAKYEWKLTSDRLLISANIDFKPKAPAKSSDVSGRIHEWITEIREIWNAFAAVNKNNPKDKVKIDFEARRQAGDFTVNVHKGNKRSDAANWYTGDHRRGLAAHEFGHLIGLADEYNREEGQFLAVTGQEPAVGKVTAMDEAKADTIAQAIKAEMPLTDNGNKLAVAVWNNLKTAQGGDSRYVAARYQKLYGSSVTADIAAAFNAKGITGFDSNKTFAIQPFLYSTGSIMGTMTEAAKDKVKAQGHDHSVEPRHVMPFVDIINRERSLERGQPEGYEPVRR